MTKTHKNKLTGPVPAGFRMLTNLEYLDLDADPRLPSCVRCGSPEAEKLDAREGAALFATGAAASETRGRGMTTKPPTTHAELVECAAKWARRNHSIVIAEMRAYVPEEPDVIAWSPARGAHSTLIECKVSRRDFAADRTKIFRRYPETGMGDRRYYATPPGLIDPQELPSGWGLIEVYPAQMRVVREAEVMEANKRAECVMLCSALRRKERER